MSSKLPAATKRTHAEMEAGGQEHAAAAAATVTLDQLILGTDAAVLAAIAATEGMMAALRGKGTAVVAVDNARRAGELRKAIEGAESIFGLPQHLKDGGIPPGSTGGILGGRRTVRHGYLGIVRKEQPEQLVKEVLDGSRSWSTEMPVDTGVALCGMESSHKRFERAFGELERVAHKALAAAAAGAVGLNFDDDLAPLLDPKPLPEGYSASYLSAIKYHGPIIPGPAAAATSAASAAAAAAADAEDEDEPTPPLLAPAHIDDGLLTVIYTTTPGLQVRGYSTGEWIDVEPATAEQRRVVVLVGAQLERATGGALKAVQHRVIQTHAPSNLPRLSLAFRLRARHTAVLDPQQLSAKINLQMPLLADPETRKPISVADFEAAFARNHPSITHTGTTTTTRDMVRTSQGRSMQIFYRADPYQNNVKTLDVYGEDTIQMVKWRICDKEGIPPSRHRICYGGMTLELGRTVESYNIQKESTLLVRFRFH